MNKTISIIFTIFMAGTLFPADDLLSSKEISDTTEIVSDSDKQIKTEQEQESKGESDESKDKDLKKEPKKVSLKKAVVVSGAIITGLVGVIGFLLWRNYTLSIALATRPDNLRELALRKSLISFRTSITNDTLKLKDRWLSTKSYFDRLLEENPKSVCFDLKYDIDQLGIAITKVCTTLKI